MALDLAAAERAIGERVAGPLGLTVAEAADGIIRIATSQMANVVKRVTTERGLDARDFTMVAYGGAGPLHATLIARELQIGRVLIPNAPGHFSACGMLTSDLRRDFVRTLFARLAEAPFAQFDTIFAEMEKRGRAEVARAVAGGVTTIVRHAADMRYIGQEHAVTVEIPGEAFAQRDTARIKARFDEVHQQRYGYASEKEGAEIVSLRLSVIGELKKPRAVELKQAKSADASGALLATREANFGILGGRIAAPIYARDKLLAGHRIEGPALVNEYASTTVLAKGDTLTVDRLGNLDIQVDCTP